jgi:hypothetical protein
MEGLTLLFICPSNQPHIFSFFRFNDRRKWHEIPMQLLEGGLINYFNQSVRVECLQPKSPSELIYWQAMCECVRARQRENTLAYAMQQHARRKDAVL